MRDYAVRRPVRERCKCKAADPAISTFGQMGLVAPALSGVQDLLYVGIGEIRVKHRAGREPATGPPNVSAEQLIYHRVLALQIRARPIRLHPRHAPLLTEQSSVPALL